MTADCRYLQNTGIARSLQLNRFEYLNAESKQLVCGWFERAYAAKNDESECFEAFIFSWFAVNGWAACVTGIDRDSEYVRALQRSDELAARFLDLLNRDSVFRDAAVKFQSFWPIFRAQSLRRAGYRADSNSRAAVVQHYLERGIGEYEPDCWKAHKDAGENVPLDWAHTLAAIYRVRCNLFHGEKSAHSEMDQEIVRSAYLTLIGFFRGAEIL